MYNFGKKGCEGEGTPWESTRDSASPGAVDALSKCVTKFGADNVFILSKCTGTMRANTLHWLLVTLDLPYRVGLRRGNIHFCCDRTGKLGKGPIAKRLGLTHYIDDRDECLRSVYEDEAGNAGDLIRRAEGQLIHMARSARGRAPRAFDWPYRDRPGNTVVAVSTWGQALEELGIDPQAWDYDPTIGIVDYEGLHELSPPDAGHVSGESTVSEASKRGRTWYSISGPRPEHHESPVGQMDTHSSPGHRHRLPHSTEGGGDEDQVPLPLVTTWSTR